MPGEFNRSAQHLLILRGEEVCHRDHARISFTAAQKAELWERWTVQGATMARGAEACSRFDGHRGQISGWLRQEFPTHDMRDISRSDLSQPLHPDPRRAEEEGADGASVLHGDRRPKSHNAKSGQGHILDMVPQRSAASQRSRNDGRRIDLHRATASNFVVHNLLPAPRGLGA